ncbi:hypothetical protein SDJN02_01485, partial [Cucurbita argyrosperma subsp. argyrosperma]
MAKRSDFAQKLLDDLRLRKQRMAAASHSSDRSKTTTIDAYAYSKQIHRGSKNARTHGTSVPSNTRYGGGNKSPMTNDTSNQIVPFTRGRNSEQIGDLSMALAFALENGGKLRGNTSSGNNLMLGFLQQIGRSSFEVGKMNKRGGLDRNQNASGYFPTISHLHIKEISKGAQKLNQILTTCSNGDFGRCSIEIGQELLKGAVNLEESLRMLVNLHEASEHMIRPQHKNRIVLLENEDDTDENKHDINGNRHEQKLATLRYTEEQPLNTVKFSFHRRTASCGHDIKTSNTREKVGISNVIAKLMGLDNLSDNSNYAHQDSGSKRKVTDQQPTARGIGLAEPRTNIKESRSGSKIPRTAISDKNSAVVNTIFDASLQAITFRGKPSWKDMEGIRPQTSPSTPTITIFRQQRNKNETRQEVSSQKDDLEGLTKQLHVKHREKKGTDRDDYREVLKNGVQPRNDRDGRMKPHHQKNRELSTTERDQKRGELKKDRMQQMKKQERTLPLEKRHPDNLKSRMQQQPPNSPKYQQTPMLTEKRNQKNGKSMVQERNQKRNGNTFKSLTKPVHDTFTFPKKQQDMNHVRQSKTSCKETIIAHHSYALPNNRCPKHPSRENNSYDLNNKTSEITDISVEQTEPVMEEQRAKIHVKNDSKSTKMPRNNEADAREQRIPILQEVEQNNDALNRLDVVGPHGSTEVEAHTIESRETIVSLQPPNSAQDAHEETERVLAPPSPAEDECHSLKEPQISAPNDSCQKTISISTSNQQDQRSVFGSGVINGSHIVINAVEEAEKYDINKLYPPHLKHLHSCSKSRKQEILTESENQLKQTLITSEWFLNAAEALFKLNIPSFILHDSGHSHLKNGKNVLIDCSYELVKRKGIRQELNNRPSTNISLRSNKIGSLDELIKQVHRDIEALRFYGKNGNLECELQDYLPKMLESDIYNQEPDLNSMWDLGWNEPTFVFLEREEVVRGVEKYVLSGLLDEVTRDLVHVYLLMKGKGREI